MNWYLKVLQDYGDFQGRARRKEYWMFGLFNLIFIIVAVVLDNILGITIGNSGIGPIYLFYSLMLFIPGLSVLVRRLHDVGKSGWMVFISFIPIVGAIWLFVLLVTDSQSGENQYGSNPKTDQQQNEVIHFNTADTILLIVVIWMFFNQLYWLIIPELFYDYYSTTYFKIINGASNFIYAFVPLGLAFVVRNKSKQMALFILGGIYLVIGIYSAIKYLTM